jgi:tetratricopeptide (TPR) repeat protein
MRTAFALLVALVPHYLIAQAATPAKLSDLLTNGVALSKKGDYARAIPLLKKAAQIAPRDYTANLMLGVDLLRSGHAADAVAPLRVAAEARPTDETAEGYLGQAEIALSNFALAAQAFQVAVSRAPNSEEALLGWADYGLERFRVLGVWLRGSQRGTAAVLRVEAEGMEDGTTTREMLLRQSAEDDPQQRGIWGELGVAQVQLGMRAAAEASLKTARERQPEASATWQLEALMSAAEGNWEEAEDLLLALGERSSVGLSRALEAWPPLLVPGQNVGGAICQCLRSRSTYCALPSEARRSGKAMNDESAFAEERWEQLVAIPSPSENDASAWFHRGVALGETGDCARAIPALERGLKAGAEAAGFWLEICYGSESERAAASLIAAGKDAAVHQLRGDMLLQMKGDAAAAETEYTDGLRLRPGDPDLLERSAQAYIALGNMAKARQAAQAVLAGDPQRKLALHLLALVAMNERNYPEALTALKKLAAIDPRDPWTRVRLGTVYAQLGQPQEAVRYLKVGLDAGYPDEKGALHAMLAGALRKLGREEEAQDATAEAARLANAFQEHGKNSAGPDDHQ